MKTLFVGIAPEHAAALGGGALALVIVPSSRRFAIPVDRWAAALLATPPRCTFPAAGPPRRRASTAGCCQLCRLRGLAWRATSVAAGASAPRFWPRDRPGLPRQGEEADQVGVLTALWS